MDLIEPRDMNLPELPGRRVNDEVIVQTRGDATFPRSRIFDRGTRLSSPGFLGIRLGTLLE